MTDFDTIYATDLVFKPECWKLCGDAHCCTFSRHKARFAVIGRGTPQELPLLPGEYDWLAATGRIASFAAHEIRRVEHLVDGRRLTIETMVVKDQGCVCAHGDRTAVCRLYPVFPVFSIEGRLTGIERLGIYDQLEDMAIATQGGTRICKIDTVPMDEMPKLLAITDAIARSPEALFSVIAYGLAHAHVRGRIDAMRAAKPEADPFRLFEMAFLRGALMDMDALNGELAALHDAFHQRYGFSLPAA
ncbi:MAG: hypothetical protein MUC58_14615 [Rhizobiaceae bacterium]|jgi:hypothetical protein|nr:hypothetical protein [Rhizobiaceae bacterium]